MNAGVVRAWRACVVCGRRYQNWFIPSVPNVYLFPHWNWPEGSNVTLWAFSNADAVELIVNGVCSIVRECQRRPR